MKDGALFVFLPIFCVRRPFNALHCFNFFLCIHFGWGLEESPHLFLKKKSFDEQFFCTPSF